MVFVVKFNGGQERSFELWSYLSVTMYHFAVFSGELLNKRDPMHFHSWTGKRGATLIWTPRVHVLFSLVEDAIVYTLSPIVYSFSQRIHSWRQRARDCILR